MHPKSGTFLVRKLLPVKNKMEKFREFPEKEGI